MSLRNHVGTFGGPRDLSIGRGVCVGVRPAKGGHWFCEARQFVVERNVFWGVGRSHIKD